MTRAVLVLMVLVTPSLGRLRTCSPPVDRDYAAALATADRFLHAWQMQDEESGLLLLTDGARRRTKETTLQDFFSSTAHARASFEIGRGKKLSLGHYQFPVSLFYVQPASSHHWMRPQTSSLVVIRTTKDDWAIDKLP